MQQEIIDELLKLIELRNAFYATFLADVNKEKPSPAHSVISQMIANEKGIKTLLDGACGSRTLPAISLEASRKIYDILVNERLKQLAHIDKRIEVL